MPCEEAEQLLCALSDDLHSDRAQALHLHLSACTACRELLASYLLLRAVAKVAHSQWANPSNNRYSPVKSPQIISHQ